MAESRNLPEPKRLNDPDMRGAEKVMQRAAGYTSLTATSLCSWSGPRKNRAFILHFRSLM